MSQRRGLLDKLARVVVTKLPLPIAIPADLRRAPVQPLPRPLRALDASVITAPSVHESPLAAALEAAGATVQLGAPTGPCDIVVLHVGHPASYEIVLELHALLRDAVSALRKNGRLVIMAPSGDGIIAGALHGFVRSLSREIGRRGVTVNAITAPDASTAAATVVFLASDRASFVTAQSYELQGGVCPAAPAVKPEVAVVTGAARGIGASIARFLAAAGYRMALLDIESQRDAGQALCEELGGEPAGMVFIPCDVSDSDAADGALQRARSLSPQGTLDVLVNNAGITRDRTFAKMTPQEWSAVMAVNLRAVVEVTRIAKDRLAEGARVVNISSVTGFAGNFGQTNYGAAKGGVIGFTRHASRELEALGITVTAVAPGFIETAMTARMPLVNREMAKQMTSLAQAGTPQDVAAVVEFLARREAWPLRGQVVRADGGMYFGA